MKLSQVAACKVFVVALIAVLTACPGCSDGKAEIFKKIPLSEVYSTSGQVGLKRISIRRPYEDIFDEFRKLSPTASNIFLTYAKDENQALGNSLRLNGYSELILSKEDDDLSLWLVVYFGAGHSNPLKWRIDAVEYHRSKVRVSCTLERGPGQYTRDSHYYLAYVPLKGLNVGSYELELFDSANREVILMRLVRLNETER